MNILLWILQGLLAAHTIIGAIWKFSNTAEQTMPSLSAIPSGVWIALSIFEIICALGLILPGILRRSTYLTAMSALGIGFVMLVYCGLHLASGAEDSSPMIYWLVVAGICAVIAFGRFKLQKKA